MAGNGCDVTGALPLAADAAGAAATQQSKPRRPCNRGAPGAAVACAFLCKCAAAASDSVAVVWAAAAVALEPAAFKRRDASNAAAAAPINVCGDIDVNACTSRGDARRSGARPTPMAPAARGECIVVRVATARRGV
eukprot:366441-Chlamydomonas_euryale.AAC.23